MKFSISSRQPEEYLNKADELFIDWKDIDVIYDVVHLAPTKTIIIRLNNEDNLFGGGWDKINECYKALNGNVKLALKHIADCEYARNHNIPFYYNIPINDWTLLNYIIELGVSEVIPGATLAHYMRELKRKNVAIRMCVDSHMMPTQDGTVGAWIRPEDLWGIYNKYVSYVEFDTESTHDGLKREQALFRIYAERKEWPGDIDMLITNLNHKGVNRLIVSDFGERRANCHQMCQVNGICHFCYRALDLANPTLLKRAAAQANQDTLQSAT